MTGPLQHSSVNAGIDPRIAIITAVALIAAALAGPRSIGAMTALMFYSILVTIVLAGGIPAVMAALRRLVPFVIIILVLNGLAVPGEAALAVFGRRLLSVEGLEAGAFFAVRLAVMALALTALIRMAPPEQFARGVHALIRPLSPGVARSAAFHGFLAMSFVPFFAGEFERIRMAQSFRGGSFTGGFVRRIESVRLVVVPLLLSAIHRSGQLATVVELRDIRTRIGRSLKLASPRSVDFAFLALTLAVILGALRLG